MRKFYKLSLTGIFVLAMMVSMAQNNFFTDQGANRVMPTTGQRVIMPKEFRTYSANTQQLKNFLWSLPQESFDMAVRNQAPIISLPMPEGGSARFRLWESSVQAPELAAKFPEIKTFLGQGIDDPYATVRISYDPYFGFAAQILSPNGRIYIDAFARWDINNYISYYHRNAVRRSPFICSVEDGDMPLQPRTAAGPCLGTQLRTYRLAVSCTGEYAVAVGGGLAGPTHAAIVASTNRVTGVYEVELAVRMVLIANNNLIEYLDGATDPFTNTISAALLNQNQANTDLVIGFANYDIGHIFTSDDNGLAQLNAVCGSGKARGATGAPVLVGDGFDIDYVAHEIGHQFGGSHTFNSGQCASPGGSYEPGGGTTIMAYAGICAAAENIQPNSDPIFHAISFDQIGTFITSGGGSACAVVTPTGNNLPTITTMNDNNVSIPINTPFVLTAAATDPDGDAITYNWEGWDVGAAGTWISAGSSTTRPLFRTRVSKTVGTRTFPDIRVIAANYPGLGAPSAMDGLRGEVLALVARTMKFRLTVRDNRAAGGGIVSGGEGCQMTPTFQVNVINTTNPFAITAPNGGESWPASSSQTITWNTVGTENAPFNAANVKITMSVDGGLTYPHTIEASTPNDGSQSVTIPAVAATTQARVRVEAIGNIFFDISNANFSITAAPGGFTFNSPGPITTNCPATNPMTATLTATYFGTFTNNISLSSSVAPAGPTVTFGTNPLTTGSNSTTVNITNASSLAPGTYTVTVTGNGGTVTQVRDIQFVINPVGPAITGHPANSTICVGGNTSFTVTSPSATSIQWQVNQGAGFNNVTNGGVYSGATTGTLTITGATAVMNGYIYRAVASTTCGSTNSNSATLTVNSSAAITNHPQDQTLCAGGTAVFNVTATGTSLNYQWEESTDGATWHNVPGGAPYSGQTTASLTITPLTAGMNGWRYRVVVAGSGPCPAPVTSNPATLNVVTSVTVTTQPTNQTICAGANASFTVAGSGTGVIYQWQVNTGSGFGNVTNGGVYSGATSATLTITGAPITMNGYLYRALVSNSTCTSPGTSNSATLTVNSLPAVSAHPNNATICVGGNTSFSATGTGTGVSYQWQVNTGSGFGNVTNGGVYSGATTSTLTITGATFSMNGYLYRVVVSGTCPPSVNSNSATLTVVNPVSITTQPTAQVAVCSGSNTSFTVVGSSTEPISYQWQVNQGAGFNNVTNGGVYSGATTATLTITGATLGMNSYRYRVLVNNVSCASQVTSGEGLLLVRALPTVGLAASPLTSLLPGQTTTLTATPSAPAVGGTQTMTWQFNGAPAVPAITGNTYVVNVEKVGAYQVLISESYTAPTLVCSNSSPIVTIIAPASTRLFIFPSPNDGRFTVSYYNNGGASSSRQIVIFDSKGGKVFDRKFNITGAYTLIPVDLRTANRGIYYVAVGDANGNKLAEGKVHIR